MKRFNSYKVKGLGKRVLSVLLAVLMVFSCFATSLTALADSSIKDVWTSSDGHSHHRLKVNGKDAFCINYGQESTDKFKTDSAALKYWNGLGTTKKNKIQNILSCAEAKGYINGSDKEYFGIQRAIWNVVTTKSEKELSDYFKSQTNSVYKSLNSNYSDYAKKAPKFGTIKLEPQYDGSGNVTSYKGSATDSNKVLSKFKFTDKAGLKTSVSGNKLTVTSTTRFDGLKTLKMTSNNKHYTIKDSQVGHFGNQQVIAIGSPSVLNTKFSATCGVNLTGNIQVNKIAETGEPMSGIRFDLYDSNGTYVSSDWTDESGSADFTGLQPGTYTVTEITPAGYVPYGNTNSVQVTVVANQTVNASNHSSGKWVNTLQRGDIYIHKTIEDTSTPYQAEFTLYDLDGNYVISGTTNTAGDLYFCNIPTGYYQIKETNTYNSNVIDWQATYTTYDSGTGQTTTHKGAQIYVSWDGQTTYPYTNNVNHNGWLNDLVGGTNLCDWVNEINFSGNNTIVNKYMRGDLRLYKVSEKPDTTSSNGYTYKYVPNDNTGSYPATKGAKFTITSEASQNALGKDLTFTTTTDEQGYAYFCDVPIGYYTVKEVEVDNKYVQPDNQVFYVAWDGNTNYDVTGANCRNSVDYYADYNSNTLTFINYLKYFRFEFSKLDNDTNSSKAQGDASLAGATYELYKGNELVGTYVTDAKGKFTTNYHICGNDYYLKEVGSSNGYYINKENLKVSEDPSKYTVRLNDTSKTNTETVKKGRIEIMKFTDDGSDKYVTPEPNAEFQIYLKSAGSYENAKNNERDLIVTGKDGYAESKALPYGEYVIHQTKCGLEGTLLADDQICKIQTDSRAYPDNGDSNVVAVYRYAIKNLLDSAYLKLVKVDADTGKAIPYNELQGAKFQILDKDLNVVKMTYTYPKKMVIDTFTLNDEGYLITPEKLPYGKYYIVEVEAPYGYFNPNADKIVSRIDSNGNTVYEYDKKSVEKTAFKIDTVNNENKVDKTDAQRATIEVSIKNNVQTANLQVEKRGEVFKTVTKNGEFYSAVYEEQGLAGAVYTVYASEDIVTPDGTVRYKKGDAVCTLTTGATGIADSKLSTTQWFGKWHKLYLGKYEIKEITAPNGFALNTDSKKIELAYQGQNVKVYDMNDTFVNERQKVEVKGTKELEVNDIYGIGNNNEVESVVFGLYANEDIIAADGTKIPKDGLIQKVNVSANGTFEFDADLPLNFDYYVKEIATDNHYKLNDKKFTFSFDYKGQDIAKQTITLNGNKPISNELKYGKISGLKVDDLGNKLANVTFGLFSKDETKFTKENAIVTVTTDKNGVFEIDNIPVGNYQLVELSAPDGYAFSKEPIGISVTEDKQVIKKQVENKVVRGQIVITKQGEFFYSTSENEDGTTTPVYKNCNLPGATFDVIAAEDITTPDGVVRAHKGDVVDTITTDENGVAKSKELFLGKYEVKETKAPKGYFLDKNNYTDDNSFKVELTFENSDKELVVTNLDAYNKRQTVKVNLIKSMEKDNIFKIDDVNALKNVVFGVFAREDMTAVDGSEIKANTLIERAKPDENGLVSFNADLPYGYKYYVKEISTDSLYTLDETEYEFAFDTEENDAEVTTISINNGTVIVNTIARGKVTGVKKDTDGTLVKGALYGLFSSDATEFTKETALMTAETDENGVFTFDLIPKGSYIIVELYVPVPYKVSNEKIAFTISDEANQVAFDVTDEFITGAISVYKFDADYPENSLSGATFTVYNDVDGNGIYDENIDTVYNTLNEVQTGFYFLDGIRYGHYLVKETASPNGFAIDENYYPVFIEEDGKTYNVTNSGESFVDTALKGTLKVVKSSSNGVVEGFTFNIKGTSTTGEKIDITEVTNSKGEINISDLRVGTYTITEVENDATDNYKIEEPKTVTIKANETATVHFYNEYNAPSAPKAGLDNNFFGLACAGVGTSIMGSISMLGYIVSKKKKNDIDD